jgi:hypothetical protein
MEGVILGLAAMPAAKRARTANTGATGATGATVATGAMVSSALVLLEPHDTQELSAAARQRAATEARAVVRQVDKVLEKMLDVRIITTQREGILQNHVNLRVAGEFSCMVHHERAKIRDNDIINDIMFCFMASSELEPVVVVVLLHGDHGRIVELARRHFDLLEIALQQFRVRFGLQGETYSYTPLQARSTCSWHSRHFHLKIRVPTEMYLRVFPAMQVLGSNHVCKRSVLETYKELWEPLRYKFELKTQMSWQRVREVVLADVRSEVIEVI